MLNLMIRFQNDENIECLGIQSQNHRHHENLQVRCQNDVNIKKIIGFDVRIMKIMKIKRLEI